MASVITTTDRRSIETLTVVEKGGRLKALKLFHLAAEHVPAYKKFLRAHKINHNKIIKWSDFEQIPPVNKKNYLLKYPFKDLHWAGKIKKPLVYTLTSGSSGNPVFFNRDRALDYQYATILKDYIKQCETKGPVLVIVGFAMGIWIGGLITYQAYEIVSNSSKYPLSLVTPGINKLEIIKILKFLAPLYSQIILVGYAPFIKEVIDEAKKQKIKLTSKIRFHFAAEAISEKFRKFILTSVNSKDEYKNTLNIYGSADMGAMAFEGPASIFIKKLAVKNKQIFKDIFSDIAKTPTLAQYNPNHIIFEAQGGELLLTGNNSLPLIRYAIGDHGGVFNYKEMLRLLAKWGVNLEWEFRRNRIYPIIRKFPFVYVYERADFSTTLYGINIYAEMIKEIFFEKGIRNHTTGRFNLMTKYDKKHNQYLEVNVELQSNIGFDGRKRKLLTKLIHESLLRKSSEYKELSEKMGNGGLIRVELWPNAHNKFFAPGTKQKWVIK